LKNDGRIESVDNEGNESQEIIHHQQTREMDDGKVLMKGIRREKKWTRKGSYTSSPQHEYPKPVSYYHHKTP
jgi:hypothetical protein